MSLLFFVFKFVERRIKSFSKRRTFVVFIHELTSGLPLFPLAGLFSVLYLDAMAEELAQSLLTLSSHQCGPGWNPTLGAHHTIPCVR